MARLTRCGLFAAFVCLVHAAPVRVRDDASRVVSAAQAPMLGPEPAPVASASVSASESLAQASRTAVPAREAVLSALAKHAAARKRGAPQQRSSAAAAAAIVRPQTGLEPGHGEALPGWCDNWQGQIDQYWNLTATECYQICDASVDCRQAVFESMGATGTSCWLGANSMDPVHQRPRTRDNCMVAGKQMPCVEFCYNVDGWAETNQSEPAFGEDATVLPGWCSNFTEGSASGPSVFHNLTQSECVAHCRADSACQQAVYESGGPYSTSCFLGINAMDPVRAHPRESRSCTPTPCVDVCFNALSVWRNSTESVPIGAWPIGCLAGRSACQSSFEGSEKLNDLFAEPFMDAPTECYDQLSGRVSDPPEAFLIVANNAELEGWPFPPFLNDKWVVLRFDDCAVKWPGGILGSNHVNTTDHNGPSFIVRMEKVVERYSPNLPGHYFGTGCRGTCAGGACAASLGRNILTEDILLVGGEACDIPLIKADTTRLGTVATVALWLFRNFPSSAVVAAGLQQATSEFEPGLNSWVYERALLDEMAQTRRFISINRREEVLELTRARILAATMQTTSGAGGAQSRQQVAVDVARYY